MTLSGTFRSGQVYIRRKSPTSNNSSSWEGEGVGAFSSNWVRIREKGRGYSVAVEMTGVPNSHTLFKVRTQEISVVFCSIEKF